MKSPSGFGRQPNVYTVWSGGEMRIMRDRSIDVSRGLLVIMMVYGHVLQFFGDAQLFPLVDA